MPTVRFVKHILRPDDGPFSKLPEAAFDKWSIATLSEELAALCVRCGYAIPDDGKKED